MVKMTKSAIVRTAGKIFKNNKKKPWGILFYTFVPIYGPKVLTAYAWGAHHALVFEKSPLNGLRNGPSDTQNSKIGHLDHPLAHLYTDTWLNKWMLSTL